MYKRVDEESDILNGFSYLNKSDLLEFVEIVNSNGIVLIRDSSERSVTIYVQDIPNLIKALQAAYEYLGSPT